MARRERSDRKDTGRAAQVGRARLIIKAHLGWLGGYPGGVDGGVVAWHGARIERIDRAAISEGTRAVKQLLREHAAVLPTVVGDVAAWQAGVERGLEELKRAVHGGAALGSRFEGALGGHAVRLAAAHPTLTPLLIALSWIRVAAPADARHDLRWLDGVGAELAEVLRRTSGLTVALHLIRLAEEETPRRVAPLIDVLGRAAVHDVVTEGTGYANNVLQRIGVPSQQLAERPTGKVGGALLALPAWLVAAPPAVRRGALRALAAAQVPELVARWGALWDAVDREGARHAEAGWDELKQTYDQLKRAIAAVPPPTGGRALLDAIQRAATRPRILDVVEALATDDHVLSRAAALIRLGALDESLDAAHAAAYLEVLHGYLAARGDRPLRPWMATVEELIEPARHSTLTRIDRTLGDVARWRKFGQALILAARAQARGLDATALESLAALVLVAEPAAAVEALRLLRHKQIGIDAVGAAAASALTTTPGELVAMAEKLRSEPDGLASAVVTLAAACGPGGAALVRALIERDERRRLFEAAAQLALAERLKLRRRPMLVAPDGEVPPWGLALPAVLQPPLARLLAAGGDNAARKILGDSFPDADALVTEIAAIERKLATVEGEPAKRLAARRGNLVARLTTPKMPSALKVANLAVALSEAAELAALDRWRAALTARLEGAVPGALELDETPPWLSLPAYREVVLGLLALDGTPRKLAHRVLAARCGPPPWDLRDDPANRAFVTRLRRAGIDPAPWVDGVGALRLGDGERALDLALEDDPLEILRMGAHFTTCLAPDAINFFATILNAGDINKRVIYGRDRRGEVVGRCLLALTDSGGILAFHPYCHDDRDFTAMVRAFTFELAARMRTVLLPAGKVTPLLDARWYDDGPEDLTGQFDFLTADSEFRRHLQYLVPDEVVPALTARFAPLPLGGHTLGLVVGLSELDDNPRLIIPLMPLLDAAPDVPLETRLRAAHLAGLAGRADLAAARLAEHLEAHARARHRALRDPDREQLDRLAVAAPSRVLAFLRDTRDRGVRSYLDEPQPARLWAAARAHELLGRPRQAAPLYQRLLAVERYDKDLRALCEARLAALATA